jgi:hypothetical protein
MADKSNKHEMNAQFAKIQRANDAKKATSEYESTAAALTRETCRIGWTDRPKRAARAEWEQG